MVTVREEIEEVVFAPSVGMLQLDRVTVQPVACRVCFRSTGGHAAALRSGTLRLAHTTVWREAQLLPRGHGHRIYSPISDAREVAVLTVQRRVGFGRRGAHLRGNALDLAVARSCEFMLKRDLRAGRSYPVCLSCASSFLRKTSAGVLYPRHLRGVSLS